MDHGVSCVRKVRTHVHGRHERGANFTPILRTSQLNKFTPRPCPCVRIPNVEGLKANSVLTQPSNPPTLHLSTLQRPEFLGFQTPLQTPLCTYPDRGVSKSQLCTAPTLQPSNPPPLQRSKPLGLPVHLSSPFFDTAATPHQSPHSAGVSALSIGDALSSIQFTYTQSHVNSALPQPSTPPTPPSSLQPFLKRAKGRPRHVHALVYVSRTWRVYSQLCTDPTLQPSNPPPLQRSKLLGSQAPLQMPLCTLIPTVEGLKANSVLPQPSNPPTLQRSKLLA